MQQPGKSRDEVFAALAQARSGDADWKHGRTFSLVYFAGDESLELIRHAYASFIHENGLSMDAFPSLRQFEREVIKNGCEIFGGASCGSMTSGGTESILMAMKAARDWARAERGGRGTVVVPCTAHPAFDKAAHTLGLRLIKVPVGGDFRADLAATEAAIDGDTIMLVGSAFSFPHGVVDDIPALASMALSRGLLCHVDACLGGFVLAFADDPVPFDFRVPGVTSLSADLHKYGYAAKGASLVLYRDRSLRRHQFFATTDWPGGLYGSPTMAGTRPGGAIAAAWAIQQYLGRDGYVRLTRQVLASARSLREGIAAVPGLRLLGDARHSVIAFTGDGVDVFAVDERLRRLGWHLDRLQAPSGVQMIVSAAHGGVEEAFLADLREVTAEVREKGLAAEADGAIYGALATMPDRELVGELVLGWLDGHADGA
ncbi:MAG: aspartate aminotransferase family protein [Deltaproteobacteria bacterium]|nr:aspartate aminotransferase family protein [Deltaproteobacteria bacterium]